MKRTCLAAPCAVLGLALILPATSLAGNGLRFFKTSDGNISCAMFKAQKRNKRKHRPRIPGEARCDVKSHTWTAPARPSYCHLDWGNGTEVGDKGLGRYVCAGDTVALPTAPVLGPGGSMSVGPYTCTVPSASVRCTNNRTGHGFEVSAAQVTLF